MASAVEVVTKMAQLRASEEAELLVQAALTSVLLPAHHPLAHPAPLGDTSDTLVYLAQLRAGIDIGRLQFRIPGWEAELYAAAYIQQFLVSVRQQLLGRLCGPEKPLLPEAENMAEQAIRSLDEALRQVAKGAGQR